jgi:hypothetical protein
MSYLKPPMMPSGFFSFLHKALLILSLAVGSGLLASSQVLGSNQKLHPAPSHPIGQRPRHSNEPSGHGTPNHGQHSQIAHGGLAAHDQGQHSPLAHANARNDGALPGEKCTGCSMKHKDKAAWVKPQPGAKVGDFVRCPVSGSIFDVKPDSPSVTIDGKTIYTCCAPCAKRFKRESKLSASNP